MTRKNGRTPARPWTPMHRATTVPFSEEKRAYFRREHGMTDEQIDGLSSDEVWKNDRYTVHVDRRDDGSVSCLSIKRNDRKPSHDWRHFQQIKNEIAGDEVEAIELYPAMSRLMDTSNQYWLWCAVPGVALTVGYEHATVADADDAIHAAVGSVQRELPDEWKHLARRPEMSLPD